MIEHEQQRLQNWRLKILQAASVGWRRLLRGQNRLGDHGTIDDGFGRPQPGDVGVTHSGRIDGGAGDMAGFHQAFQILKRCDAAHLAAFHCRVRPHIHVSVPQRAVVVGLGAVVVVGINGKDVDRVDAAVGDRGGEARRGGRRAHAVDRAESMG